MSTWQQATSRVKISLIFFQFKLSRQHWLSNLPIQSSIPTWCPLKTSKKSFVIGSDGICWPQRSIAQSKANSHNFDWRKLLIILLTNIKSDLEASFWQKLRLNGTFQTKQRRHPTRLPTEPAIDLESGSSDESSSEEDSSLESCSEESDISSSSEDESDDSDSSNTETGTISEEYTVDSD